MPRRYYLVILTVLVVALATTGIYVRQRAVATERAAAECDSPALPPPPASPLPRLPGFTLEPGCGTAAAPAADKANK